VTTLAIDVSRLVDPVLAASRQPIAISDPSLQDNPLIFVNDAFAQLTGYRAEDLVGRNCRFLQQGTSQPAAGRLAAAVAEGRPTVETLLNFRLDGSSFYNLISVTPVRGWLGERTYFVATAQDVTDRLL
jgi:PAS domain S-box-containing protein